MKGQRACKAGGIFLAVVFVVSAAVPSWAATEHFWTGASGDGLWNSAGNWSVTGKPSGGAEECLYFQRTGDYDPSPNNNIASPLSLKNLIFNSGAPAIRLVGGAIRFNVGNSSGGVYQNSANSVRIDNALSWTAEASPNPMNLQAVGGGDLILAGGLTSSTAGGRLDLNVGSVVFSAGQFDAVNSWALRVGNTAPAALAVQDNATVTVRGDLDINYGCTLDEPSTLTLKSGTLAVTGATVVGRASLRAGPESTSAAFYQSGGTATFTGLVTVGYDGTATSLLAINAGTMSASGGLIVGDGATGRAGNGVVNILGSGSVSVTGGSGLVIGKDSSRATSGKLSLSAGSLSVTGNLVLGSGGGMGTFSRLGGSLTVTGNLTAGGVGTLVLDDTKGAVQTAFGGTLTRSGSGTLVVVPYNGHLAGNERVTFGTAPSSTNGMIGPWLVAQTSASDSSGTYLTYDGKLASSTYTACSGSHTTVSGELLDVAGTSSLTDSGAHAWALRVGPYTTTLTNTVTLGSGGVILNGGTVTGGTLALGSTPLVYAGSSTASTIASGVQTNAQLVKFGSGTLVLSAANTAMTGGVALTGGTLRVQHGSALGSSTASVAAGASLEISGGSGSLSVANALEINGSGVNDGGALRNLDGTNTLSGTITLKSDSKIGVSAGTLTLSGSVVETAYVLTKTGGGTLVLAGNSGSFPGSLAVAGGTLNLRHNNALGTGGSAVTLSTGSTLELQGGITIPGGTSLTLAGAGTDGSGALRNVQGNNTWSGPITLAADSTVGIDSAADTLTFSGDIDGDYVLNKTGSGTLVLSGTNSFGGALRILDGTLKVSDVQNAGSDGPLGAGTAMVSLGSSSVTATFLFAGATDSTDREFTLATGGSGRFQVDQDSTAVTLALSGAIRGSGNLVKTGDGTLTLSGQNVYTGSTAISGGKLAIGSTGSINASSAITVYEGSLEVTAGSGAQLPDTANISLLGGGLHYIGNGTTGAGETAGALVLKGGPGTVTATRQGTSSTPYLAFAGISHTPGGTVSFSATDCQIRFSTKPTTIGGILGGFAFYEEADFAACSSTAPYTVSACSSYTTGDLAGMSGTGINAKPTSASSFSADKTINSLNLTGAVNVVMTGSLTLLSGGLIANHTNGGTISGGTLKGSPSGELVINALEDLGVLSVVTDNGGATALVKVGEGELTLAGENTYTGGTIVAEGTLVIADADGLPPGGSLTIGSGGTLVLGGGMALASEAVSLSAQEPPGGSDFSRDGQCAPVPEPGTLLLLAAGFAAATIFGLWRRFA